MSGMNGTNAVDAYQNYASQTVGKKGGVAGSQMAEQGKEVSKKSDYGKTIGEPKLSEKAQKYYEKLKKKFGNYDFILVSEDQKANAQANAGKYANQFKTVVLIDEEKIERMASDENYRKKYENILSGASSQLKQLKDSMEKSGASVKGYGMQVNDGGTTSFFAVLKKSSADQKARIQKSAEKKKAAQKEADKKAEKKSKEERLKETREKRAEGKPDLEDDSDTVVISANSVEELMQKVGDFRFAQLSDQVQTESEKMIGQHVDFRG